MLSFQNPSWFICTNRNGSTNLEEGIQRGLRGRNLKRTKRTMIQGSENTKTKTHSIWEIQTVSSSKREEAQQQYRVGKLQLKGSYMLWRSNIVRTKFMWTKFLLRAPKYRVLEIPRPKPLYIASLQDRLSFCS